jgi:hypothetical protein
MECYYHLKNTKAESKVASFWTLDLASEWLLLHKILFVNILLIISWLLSFLLPQLNAAEYQHLVLELLDRTITQDQGAWVVEYRFRNTTNTGIILTPEELKVKIEGWVSNSRVGSHTIPQWSSLVAIPGTDSTVYSDVIVTADELHRCREYLALLLWAENGYHSDSKLVSKNQDSVKTIRMPVSDLPITPLPSLSLGPGNIMHLRLRIDHQHILYGDYDPLLGIRTVELMFSSFIVRDFLPLDQEQYLAQPKYNWPALPDDRCDTRQFVSAPDSLYLQADVHGHQSYRYHERPVRYNTKMMLRFWYLIATGTEGECCIRVVQNKDTPLAWRQLQEANFEEPLKIIGHWTKYERIVQTEPEATRLILEFKIVGDMNIGEMWIDDVSLEPINSITPSGP